MMPRARVLALCVAVCMPATLASCVRRDSAEANLRSSAVVTRARRGGPPMGPAPVTRPEPPQAPPVEEPGVWWSAYEGAEAIDAFEGRASYYHDSLAGNRTASGEPYDPREHTAASRDLPFGTVLRVVRPDTGQSVIVRVNDRGPFGDRRRVLDLSRAAAEAIDMVRRGVVDVHVEVLALPE